MNLTLAEVAMGAGAVLEAPASVSNAGTPVATGYSINSRTIAPGELFFAVGPKYMSKLVRRVETQSVSPLEIACPGDTF